MGTEKTLEDRIAPMLSNFRTVAQHVLRAVWQVTEESCTSSLILEFDEESIAVHADETDDSVNVIVITGSGSSARSGVDVSQRAPWRDLVGKRFIWGWITVNQQGYCDGALLSFEGAIPQIVLNVAASSLKVGSTSLE